MNHFLRHLIGIIYRRFLVYKRSGWSVFITVALTLTIASISILVSLIIQAITTSDEVLSSFDSFSNKVNLSIARISTPSCGQKVCFPELADYLSQMCEKDTGIKPNFYDFSSFDEFNEYTYQQQLPNKHGTNFAFSYQITNTTEIKYNENGTVSGNINLYYQTNTSSTQDAAYAIIRRGLWKIIHQNPDADFNLIAVHFSTDINTPYISSLIGPMFIAVGMIIISSLFIGQIIDEIKTFHSISLYLLVLLVFFSVMYSHGYSQLKQ